MEFVQRRVPPVMQAYKEGKLRRRLNRALISALSDMGETDLVRGAALAARLQLDDAQIEAKRVGDTESLAAIQKALKAVGDVALVRWRVTGGGEAFEERRDTPSVRSA